MQKGAADEAGRPPSFEQWAAAADALTKAFERLHRGEAGARDDVKRLSSELQTLNQQLKTSLARPGTQKNSPRS